MGPTLKKFEFKGKLKMAQKLINLKSKDVNTPIFVLAPSQRHKIEKVKRHFKILKDTFNNSITEKAWTLKC